MGEPVPIDTEKDPVPQPVEHNPEAEGADAFPIDRPPETDEELRRLIYWCFGIIVPDYPYCSMHGPHKDHTTPFRALADAFFSNGSVVHVWKGSREFGGKTFLLSLLGILEAAFLGAEVNVLAGSGEQSTRVITTQNDIWTRDKAERLRLNLVRGPLGARTTKLANGGVIKALMASEKSVRGPHPHRLRVDECDEMKLTLVDSALGQPATKISRHLGKNLRRNAVLASTQQYADRAMSELIKRCHDGPIEKRYNFYEWCWRETVSCPENPWGWLDPISVVEKRDSLPESMWEAEYEGQEPNPTDRAFLTEKIRKMFRDDLGVMTQPEGEFVLEEWNYAGRYSIGVDWARTVDRTIFAVLRFDVKPAKVVYFRSLLRRAWDDQLALFRDLRLRYHSPPSSHDASGVGDFQASRREPGVEDVHLQGLERTNIFGNYIRAVEHEEIVAPMIRLAEKEHRMCSNEDLASGSQKGHAPDSVVACALAYKAASRPRLVGVSI